MIEHTVEVIIHRPAPEVFAFLTTTRNLTRWQQALLDVTSLSGEPWRNGMRILEKRKIGGRTVEVQTEISNLITDKGFDVKSLNGPQTEGHFRLESGADGTHLRFTIHMQMKGFMRLLEPLMANRFRLDVDASFARLKTLIEA